MNDGNLSINVSVKCSPVLQQSHSSQRKRSGNGARRRRRRKQRSSKTGETSNHIATTENTLLQTTMMTADNVHVAKTDFDVLVQESTLSSPSEIIQREKLYHVPPAFEGCSYSDEAVSGDLIDLDTCLPNSLISNKPLTRIDGTSCNYQQEKPPQPPTTLGRHLLHEDISSPQVELLMYEMVKEVYRRSMT